MMKLGIVVPYKNRPKQLQAFKDSIELYITDFPYELIVVEQVCEGEFNRGKLLNIGFLKAKSLGCGYVVFHDIDMLPVDVDYSFSENVTHLISELDTPEGFERTMFDEYFGGVTLFPIEVFENINGFTNEYRGWGFEDDNLLLRCKEAGVKLDKKLIKQKARDGVGLKFNGKDSYVQVPNILNTARDFTIYTNFKINKIASKEENITDINSIFSIPGFDTTLSYNSFRNITFQFWKKDMSSMNIASDHFPEGTYSVAVRIENRSKPRTVTLFINGTKIDSLTYDKLNLFNSNHIYLGVGDPNREEKQNWFNGIINTFAVFDSALPDLAIQRLSSDNTFSLFDSVDVKPKLYYDGKFKNSRYLIDLSGNNNNGACFNCITEKTTHSKEIDVNIPFRRKGKFKALPHVENGYTNGYWKSWQSRVNQLDYFKRLYEHGTGYHRDGLTTLEYKNVEEIHNSNYHLYKVNLV